ncbi:unnamed protein product [Prorocentrum cordatum]|uniref:Tetratricopeptide repeat protein n=1 Tax=Prorocentrum cordatum TaxID=2364126 RepID=A0ABN9W6Y5_9DINO|nr:unnamed protein product [Polarella glacialis]
MEGAYCMGKNPLKKGVMVDNKRVMHDAFVQCGLAFMRPRQFAYPRKYSPGLADRIKRDLCVGKGGAVVLKLVNRARGAGVLVCPAADLDATLRQLLQVPAGNDMEVWLQRQAPRAVQDSWSGSPLDEQRLHFWSNESPVFVAEQLCRSEPVSAPLLGGAGAEGAFDGTMRVAFALRGAAQGGLELEWLGGYWKLPPAPAALGEPGGLAAEQLHACIISSFNTEEKRTAEVPEAHLQAVYAALGPALTRVFELDIADWQVLISSYPDEAAFRAFVLCRCAANLRGVGQWDKSWWLLDRAAKHVQVARPKDPGCLPERAVLSYVERTRGTNFAMKEEWGKATPHFERALDLLPSSASAYYLKGVALQERQRWEKAADCHLRALALDPDFRTPAMALSECWSRLGRFEQAIEASLACLHRQPDAAVAQYNMAQAAYQLLRQGHQASEEELRRLRRLALDSLDAAESSPFFPEDKWTEVERQMRRYFRAGKNRETLPKQPLKSCKTYAWRP